jgi:hypothetical protein
MGDVPKDVPNPYVEPLDFREFSIFGAGPDPHDRVMASLIRRSLPAILLQDSPRDGSSVVVVRLFSDEVGQILRWVNHEPGVHGWDVVEDRSEWVDLASELDGAIASDNGLYFDGDFADAATIDRHLGGPGGSVMTSIRGAFAADAFTWYASGTVDGLEILARQAGQSLVACPVENGFVGGPTESADAVFESGVWAAKGGLFLVRSGKRWGAGFASKANPFVIRWWDEDWTTVDPSERWETDSEGRHVRDYLEFLLPDLETEPWTTNFGLDGSAASDLRAVLRSRTASDAMITRLVNALGLPPLLSDVATGTVTLSEVDGARVFEPNTLWGVVKQTVRGSFADPGDADGSGKTLKEAFREELQRPMEYPRWAAPFAWWDGQRDRRSPLFLGMYLTAAAVLGVSIALSLAAGDTDALWWWKVAALTVVAVDVVRPRRKVTAPEGQDPVATTSPEE